MDYSTAVRSHSAHIPRYSISWRLPQLYPKFFHSTFWEKERDQPIARTREFVVRAFDRPPAAPDFENADRAGYTADTYRRLKTPLSPWSPRRLAAAAQHWALRTGGRLSRGIRLGWKTGFDSGESLDHIYRDRAEGATPLGRLIDRVYLNSPGWKGIRVRKRHMAEMLDRALARVKQTKRKIQIVDIASGPGRYVLEAIERHPDLDISAQLRDRDPGGLEAGRRLAEEKGIRTAIHCEGDAFDEEALATLEPRPDIAIVSGLYELFPDNAPVVRSLGGLGKAVRDAGFLIYTNQPWHPQQEMIARVLPNRDGEPWIMRCRAQAEMDALVARAGFEKVDMLVDANGIFTVSLAVKRAGRFAD